MNRLPFATLIFRGVRFEAKLLPLEALAELAAYRDLIVEVAKGLFRASHPGRQRVRKHFESELHLVLGRLEGGSAVSVIERIPAEGWLIPLPAAQDADDYFESARALIEEGIEAVARGGILPTSFPADAVSRFNAFGRGLKESDSIVIATGDRRDGPSYNKAIRKRILIAYDSKYEDAVDLGGLVRAADLDDEFFQLRTDGGKRVKVRCAPLFLPVALRAAAKGDIRVTVTGTGLFDANDELLEVIDAHDVTVEDTTALDSCPNSVSDQLDMLLTLQDGWLDGTGARYAPKNLTWLRELLPSLLAAFDLPVPFLYPTPAALVRAEWSSPRWEVVVEFDLSSRTGQAFGTELTSRRVDEMNVVFARPGAEATLGRFVASHLLLGGVNVG